MSLSPLGDLTPDKHYSDWLHSAPLPVPFFDNLSLPFILEQYEQDPAPQEFEAAVTNFLKLTPADRAAATQYVFEEYQEVLDCVGEGYWDFTIDSPEQVWEHVHPRRIRVLRRPFGNERVYVVISAACDWEEEHGLQIVYFEGRKLARVSGHDGHVTYMDAYDVPESEDRIR